MTFVPETIMRRHAGAGLVLFIAGLWLAGSGGHWLSTPLDHPTATTGVNTALLALAGAAARDQVRISAR
jgi:hypothetical protein